MTQNKLTLGAEFAETTDQVQSYNIQQPIFLNQLPIVQNQQLVYQVEGVQSLNNLNFGTANSNGQQSLLYIVIPSANESVQIETVPVDVLKKEKDGVDAQAIEFVKVDEVNDGKGAAVVNEVLTDGTGKGDKYFLNNATIQVS